MADTLILNSQGDSITFGVERLPTPANSSDGGYRYHLDLLLMGGSLPGGFDDYRFLGGLTDVNFQGGSSATHADTHYGIRGIEASAIGRGLYEGGDPTSGDLLDFGNEPGENSLAFRNANRGSSSGYFPFNPDGATEFFTPNRELIHIGTNTLAQINNLYANPNDTIDLQATAVAAEASWQLGDYLGTLGGIFDSTSGGEDTKFYVARTIPLLGDFWGSGTQTADGAAADGNIVGELQASYLYAYGDGATPGLGIDEVVAGLSTATADRIEIVDMFRIDVNDLDMDYLAASQGLTVGEVLALIDNDGDTYVDWATGIDESDFASLSSVTGVNLNLIGDGVHPTDLGYAVIANVWYNELTVPEPTSGLALLAAAGCLLTLRRRTGSE